MTDEDQHAEKDERRVDKPPSEGEVGNPDQYTPKSKKKNLHERQEDARRWLAYSLVFILGIEIAGTLLLLFCGVELERIKEWLMIVIGPTVALVGSATGFYFGTNVSSDKKSE